VATQSSNLYDSALSTQPLSGVGPGTSYRVDAPSLEGRFWVYNPLTDGWGWLPMVDTQPGDAPTPDELAAILNPPPPDPRTYLYQQWPEYAARMDCIISVESTWNPSARNPRSGAAGLAQFMPATWARTPQGQAGLSIYDAYANIDAFGWMVAGGGGSWYEWSAVSLGYC
jgi:hypothetical protein